MKHKTFFWFILPSSLAMLLFIALPIVSVVTQSMFTPHEQVIVEVENCDIFSCKKSTMVDQEATRELREAKPLGRFVGGDVYTNRSHLATSEIALAWKNTEGLKGFFSELMNLPFYRALAFTLTFTLVVTPAVLVLGFMVAVAVNSIPKILRGPTIFLSLLPMIITPLIGSLILFWMIDSRGIIGAFIQNIMGDPNLSLKASTPLTWGMLIFYGIWHAAPFSFVVYYAGLQTVPKDTLESAMIDGASKWQQIRYVIVPHLIPLTTFITLMQLMDNFRVFEPIVSFNASAHAMSLSYFIYDDLGGETRLLSSAAATSVLTILGICVLLTPVLISTWREFGRK